MSTWIVSALAAWGAVVIILAVGLVLAHSFIRRADQAQARTCAPPEQPQEIVIGIEELPEGQQETGMVVISNDVIDGTSHHHHHHHLKKESVSADPIYPDDELSALTTAADEVTHSNTSIINPLTDKITLKY
jgi:hypothetical protein